MFRFYEKVMNACFGNSCYSNVDKIIIEIHRQIMKTTRNRRNSEDSMMNGAGSECKGRQFGVQTIDN